MVHASVAKAQVRNATPVDLEPSTQPSSQPSDGALPPPVDRGQWSFHIERAERDAGVPWKLIATPVSGLAEQLKTSREFQTAPTAAAIPVLNVPEQVWDQWFTPDMKDVVGIHYHEMFGVEPARVLFTVHKVPPDGADGQPPTDYKGVKGTRIEATLLMPITFHLDQAVVVRGAGIGAVAGGFEPHRPRGVNEQNGDGARQKADPASMKAIVDNRVNHEVGHAEVSLKIIERLLAGPQNWDLEKCRGQRSTLTWYYKTDRVTRKWGGYSGGSGKILTQRLSVTLAPPTRWSMLLPIPPEDLTQAQITGFNDWITMPHLRFAIEDREEQAAFHADHGEYENK